MDATFIIQSLITLGSILAAILAWLAKLKWSEEYAKAKDETIRSKEAQIEVLREQIQSLKDLSSATLRENYVSFKKQMEEFNNSLRQSLISAETEISKLKEHGGKKEERISQLEKERDELKVALNSVETFTASTAHISKDLVVSYNPTNSVYQDFFKEWNMLFNNIKCSKQNIVSSYSPLISLLNNWTPNHDISPNKDEPDDNGAAVK